MQIPVFNIYFFPHINSLAMARIFKLTDSLMNFSFTWHLKKITQLKIKQTEQNNHIPLSPRDEDQLSKK